MPDDPVPITPIVLAAQVRIVARPRRGVVHLPREVVEPGDVGPVDRRQTPRRAQQEPAAVASPPPTSAPPTRRRLVEARPDDLGVEPVVTPQIEPVRHMVQIRQDLGLRGEPLRPRPVALQVLVERVGVVDTFDVAARTGIAVPVPGAAHARAPPRCPAPSVPPRRPGAPRTARRTRRRSRSRRRSRRRLHATASSRRMSAHSSSRAAAPAANGMIVRKPWNSPG